MFQDKIALLPSIWRTRGASVSVSTSVQRAFDDCADELEIALADADAGRPLASVEPPKRCSRCSNRGWIIDGESTEPCPFCVSLSAPRQERNK